MRRREEAHQGHHRHQLRPHQSSAERQTEQLTELLTKVRKAAGDFID